MEQIIPEQVIAFWFDARVRPHWFNSTPELDHEIHERFIGHWEMGAQGQLDVWETKPLGAVALAIVLDQFPLNMFRGTPESFSTEALAREVAARAIGADWHASMSDDWKRFLFMPFMHSEALADQDRSVELYEKWGPEENVKWAEHHRDIVRRFGRFPHRNAILGRESTAEEVAWLASEDGFKG